jgi:hypothetical protein
MSGDAYCSKQEALKVKHPSKDSDWDGTDFFDLRAEYEEELAMKEELMVNSSQTEEVDDA